MVLHVCRVFVLLVVITHTVWSQEVSAATATETRTASSIKEATRVHRWKNTNGITNFNIEVRGKVEVTDDDKDIKSVSNDGYVQITKTIFGSRRAIIIESIGGGKFKKEYYEGRSKMDWDPHGKEWLGEILPEIVRSSTLGAEGRVNRIFAKGGVPAVLEEISNLEGDYTRAHYAKLLLDKNIPEKEMANVVTTLAEEIESAYYLSTVFQEHVAKMLSTPEAANAFYLGVQKIDSDYYQAVVLKEALKKFPASPKQVKVILQTAATMDSDYYLSVVLTALLEEEGIKEESLTELIIVSKNIPSDYYRSQVLIKAIEKSGLSKTALKSVIDALGDVDSDYYKTGVVMRMADRSSMDGDVQDQVIKLVGTTVSSDYYASSALNSIISKQKLTDESFKELVTVAGNLGSANYASDVLRRASQENLSKNKLIDILDAAGNIDSDHYLSEVLMGLASQVSTSDAAVKDAYRRAAKKIDSETYYGKVLKAID